MKKVINLLNRNKKLRISVIAVALVVMFFCCSGFIVSQAADINRLKNQEEAYNQQLSEQQRIMRNLKKYLILMTVIPT